VLGQADLVPAGFGQRQVGDLEVEAHVYLSDGPVRRDGRRPGWMGQVNAVVPNGSVG
jgi:hypothetical protein